uniref:Ovule protein n=1 Tax=Heterorhabditis bacteriophora TaxID=37862 RepID=A0A1I7WJW6_HETBA
MKKPADTPSYTERLPPEKYQIHNELHLNVLELKLCKIENTTVTCIKFCVMRLKYNQHFED